MSIGISRDTHNDAARQDISGAVTAVLIRHVRNRVGDPGVAHMLQSAGEQRSAAELEDLTGWSAHDEAIALFNAAAGVTADPQIGLHVGEEMLRQYDGTDIANRLRSLGSPSELLQNVTTAMAKFNTVSLLEPLEVGDAHAVIQAWTRIGFQRHHHLCGFTHGLLSQVPVLFGYIPALVTESECQATGGRFCLYSVAWEAGQWGNFVDERTSLYSAAWSDESVIEAPAQLPMDDDSRIAQLTTQLAQMGERLDGVFSAATELLADEDISTLLDRITTRAAHAVSAPRHLLVVRTAADAPLQLHHHGFKLDEAYALANELWQDVPDDADGSRLIVNIASSRRFYGRLAAVFPPGFRFFESEREILRLYANYAATALDVVTSLDDARTSDATARTLLNFSRSLSLINSTEEVAQLLADTVPLAVPCEDATVMLWDSERQLLSIGARTAGSPIPPPNAGQSGRPTGEVPVVSMAEDEKGQDDEDEGESEPDGDIVVNRSDTPVFERVLSSRKIVIIDESTNDPYLKALMEETGTNASIVAPMFAGDTFMGAVSANFRHEVDPAVYQSTDMHERLSGLVDQAVISFQNAELMEQISHMAWHDVLTGLPNRRLLQDRVDQELVRARRVGESVCMFFIDLDRFKSVNDSLGHAAGDELIRQVAQRLLGTIRRQDTVARLGGDEFAVLLPGLSDAEAVENLARRSLDALSAPYDIEGHDVRTSASIGIAITPQHGNSYDELLSKADEAMYFSKKLGRNTFHIFESVAQVVAGPPSESDVPDIFGEPDDEAG